MAHVHVDVDQMQVFVINKESCNSNKWRCQCKELFTKEYVMKYLFGIEVTVNMNVITHVT